MCDLGDKKVEMCNIEGKTNSDVGYKMYAHIQNIGLKHCDLAKRWGKITLALPKKVRFENRALRAIPSYIKSLSMKQNPPSQKKDEKENDNLISTHDLHQQKVYYRNKYY